MRLLILCSVVACAADFYVAPNGTLGGAGTIVDPWSIGKVATGSTVVGIAAGDTVWFRGGEYLVTTGYTFGLVGTSGSPIRLRCVEGEVCTFTTVSGPYSGLSYLVRTTGSHQWLQGFTFHCRGDLQRDIPGSSPPTVMPDGFQASSGTGNRLINSIGLGCEGYIYATAADVDTSVYGLVTVAVGSQAPDGEHGGVAYGQNTLPSIETHEAGIHISSGPANYGYRLRSTTANKTEGFRALKNILIDVQANSYLCGDCAGMEDVELSDTLWRTGAFAYIGNQSGTISTGVTIARNSIRHVNGFTVWSLDNTASIQANKIRSDGSTSVVYRLWDASTQGTLADNQYYNDYCLQNRPSGAGTYYRVATSPTFTTDWQGILGRDVDSTCQNAAPLGNWTAKHANTYEPGRYHIGIIRFDGSSAQDVGPFTELETGAPYELIDAYDPTAVIATGVYDGGLISIPLTGTGLWTPSAAQYSTKCWNSACSTCYTDPGWKSGETVASFGTGDSLYQPAIVSGTGGGLTLNQVYYWSGSAWTSAGSGNTCDGNVAPVSFARDPDAFAFILRRKQTSERRQWVFNAASMSASSVTLTYSYAPDLSDPQVLTGSGSGIITIDAPPQLTGPIWGRWCYDTTRCGNIERIILP